MTAMIGHRISSGVTRLLIAPISVYQRWISPALPPRCRFYPTCSAYALEALVTHGPLLGLWLILRRLARCHPFHPGGYDPVPPGQHSGETKRPPAASSHRSSTTEGVVRWIST